MSVFCFLDEISEVKKNESLTAFWTLKGTEEFLKDHFENFPVMPGVLQLETVKQAALKLLELSEGKKSKYRLLEATNIRYGQFVKPGNQLKIFVRFLGKKDSAFVFDGRIDLLENGIPKGKALVAEFLLAASD